MDPPQTKSWSIHTRQEITSKYSILERIGSGAYSDVYKAIRKSDNLTVALKEIHDYQSSFREIEALNSLQNSPNVVVLLEYFWSEDEDAVLVLEYLPTDLSDVIKEGDLSVGQIKRWMVQILSGVDTCHRNNIVHRDLKPSNLLISPHGVLKLADFGQARILLDTPNNGTEEDRVTQNSKEEENEDTLNLDLEEDPLKNTQSEGSLTSCVGTRWFRAPELLYGSTNYKFEIDLWSLGCIFAELLSLKPLFPGTSDIDQISRIFNVMGNMSEEIWPGCVKLPDYNLISFGEVENPIGLEACLPNRGSDEINLVKKLLCFDPEKRATAIELLNDKYLNEEPLPVPISELRVPLKQSDIDNEESPGQYEDFNSDSDMDDEFGPMSFTKTDKGFSIRFS